MLAQRAHDLAQRPDGVVQEDKLALQLVDPLHRLLRRVLDQLGLDGFDAVAQLFEDHEVIVHDRVDQRIGQIVGARLADAALARSAAARGSA